MDEHAQYLQSEAQSAQVVVFRSGLTDMRNVIAHLDQAGVDYREVVMPMGRSDNRERFHSLQQSTGWRTLPQVFVNGRFIGGADELLSHPLLVNRNDPVARYGQWLGYAGLLPFVGALAGLTLGDTQLGWRFERLLLAYGAVILSFVGAVHWGMAMAGSLHRPHRILAISIIPPLTGWLSLALTWPAAPGLQLLSFGGFWLYEKTMPPGVLPLWYVQLRLRVTAVVCIVLAIALFINVPE